MILSGKKDFETISKEVQLQADKLIAEFFDHYEQMKNAEAEPIDQRVAFEGWIIQKIAGLQVLIKGLHNEIEQLHS
ncbi:MAG: hypothetical protein ABFR82_17220 [Nitrospirota bacterium]